MCQMESCIKIKKTLFGEAKEGHPSLGQGYHGLVDPWESFFRRFWCWFCTVVRTTVQIFVLVPFLVPVYRYGVPVLQSLLYCLSPLHFLFFQEFPPAAKLSKFSVMPTERVTVCGKPHSNKPLWAAYVAALASLGIATYRFCFSPRRTKGAKAE